ncbi:hypothetical protein [Salinarimonas sp.]|uniref:hypothetical protein n=1 Tax=Salinarimonas sp. TaxID=2766526 RepID=UPI00391A2D37
MKAFIAAIAVATIAAFGAAYLLETSWQSTAATSFATEGARVGDPGHNLVGPSWYGGRS